nr:reverse transcriptase domain-containing protein [Tanacetum cinerariifolium]
KFTFPADFVVVDYDVDPRVPLILGRPFLRTTRALFDVHGEELILRDGDENLIFHADSTLKHPHKHGNESVNIINFIDITCEDRFPEEFSDELDLLDPFPPGKEDNNFDFEAYLREIEYLLNQDPSTQEDIDSEKDKNKDSKMKSLVVEAHIVESNDLLPQLLDNDLTLPEEPSESSEIASLSSSPFRNEDKIVPCFSFAQSFLFHAFFMTFGFVAELSSFLLSCYEPQSLSFFLSDLLSSLASAASCLSIAGQLYELWKNRTAVIAVGNYPEEAEIISKLHHENIIPFDSNDHYNGYAINETLTISVKKEGMALLRRSASRLA